MTRGALVAAATLAGAIVADPRRASACGPPYDPSYDDPPCSFVKLWTPSDRFPVDLEGAIRIGTFDRFGNAEASQPAFDPAAQITIDRSTASGYEAVAFTLVTQPGLVPNALHVVLADPQPGQYVVSTPYGTCAADPSPTGGGRLVGAFALEPSVALPTSLGTLTWLGEHSETKVLQVDNGNCGTTEVTTTVSTSTIELQLADGALPWSKVIDTSQNVDGASYQGFSRLVVADGGVARFELTRTCSSSQPSLVAVSSGVGPGSHSFEVIGMIENLGVFHSDDTSFSLSCDDDPAADDSGWLSGGCSVGRHGHANAWWLLLLVVASRSRAWTAGRRRGGSSASGTRTRSSPPRRSP